MNLWEPILAMIMAISSFAVKANPKAPSADAVLTYAIDDADVVAYVDLKPTVIDNYPTWQKLPDDPLIKQSPELRDGLQLAISQAEGARAMAKAMLGIDVTTDLTSITSFVRINRSSQPDFLLAIRGTVPADLPANLAQKFAGKTETIDGRVAVSLPDGSLVGFTKDGVLLAGARDWVAPRLADNWKAPARGKGSPWAQIATALDARPFLLLASKPSADASAHMAEVVPASFGKDLVSQHALVIVSASSTGINWTFQAKDAAFANRIKVASDGLIELMRASHVVPRGMAELVVAALPSYLGHSPEIDDAIKHKDQIMAAVTQLTGDGKFAATVKQTGTTVTVTTKAAKISDVVPVGAVVALAAVGFAIESRGFNATPVQSAPMMRPIPARPTPPRSSTPSGAAGRSAPGHP
jgi:hypothetical protein